MSVSLAETNVSRQRQTESHVLLYERNMTIHRERKNVLVDNHQTALKFVR